MKYLQRYNCFYNDECASLSHGGPTSMEELQAMALEAMVKAFSTDDDAYSIAISDIKKLAHNLRVQGIASIDKARQAMLEHTGSLDHVIHGT